MIQGLPAHGTRSANKPTAPRCCALPSSPSPPRPTTQPPHTHCGAPAGLEQGASRTGYAACMFHACERRVCCQVLQGSQRDYHRPKCRWRHVAYDSARRAGGGPGRSHLLGCSHHVSQPRTAGSSAPPLSLFAHPPPSTPCMPLHPHCRDRTCHTTLALPLLCTSRLVSPQKPMKSGEPDAATAPSDPGYRNLCWTHGPERYSPRLQFSRTTITITISQPEAALCRILFTASERANPP